MKIRLFRQEIQVVHAKCMLLVDSFLVSQMTKKLCVNLILLLLLLLLLHDLYSANFEDRVGGAGVARWRT